MNGRMERIKGRRNETQTSQRWRETGKMCVWLLRPICLSYQIPRSSVWVDPAFKFQVRKFAEFFSFCEDVFDITAFFPLTIYENLIFLHFFGSFFSQICRYFSWIFEFLSPHPLLSSLSSTEGLVPVSTCHICFMSPLVPSFSLCVAPSLLPTSALRQSQERLFHQMSSVTKRFPTQRADTETSARREASVLCC